MPDDRPAFQTQLEFGHTRAPLCRFDPLPGPRVRSGGKGRVEVPQFWLVFRDGNGDRNELCDTNNGEPHLNGTLLVDGASFEHHGSVWLATREDIEDGLIRFVCTPT